MWENPDEVGDFEPLNSESSVPVQKVFPHQGKWSSNHGFLVLF